ncbi:MAG TPA: mechanosensitive ion channel family protein, partial [Dongiaceae bacterium]
VTNSSRDFGRAVFDIPVAFSEDYDRMVDILQKTAAELKADPNLDPLIMGAPTQPVLDRFTDNAMIIHMEIKTPPGKQSDVVRAFNRRLKQRFDELGIEMPMPSRRLLLTGEGGVANGGEHPRRQARRA